LTGIPTNQAGTMILKYLDTDGRQVIIHLKARQQIVIGRGAEADVPVNEPKASRRHCEIRVWETDYVLTDLKSRNGTFVNNQRVDVALLKPGDTIRIGTTVFDAESEMQKGPQTILRELEQEMTAGQKAYGTALREIVASTGKKRKVRE
jgi:pSer/pThr/pTyr-binding forkhead associated (FHA) protein